MFAIIRMLITYLWKKLFFFKKKYPNNTLYSIPKYLKRYSNFRKYNIFASDVQLNQPKTVLKFIGLFLEQKFQTMYGIFALNVVLNLELDSDPTQFELFLIYNLKLLCDLRRTLHSKFFLGNQFCFIYSQ